MYLNINNMSSSYPNLLDQAVLRQFISETSEPREKPPLHQESRIMWLTRLSPLKRKAKKGTNFNTHLKNNNWFSTLNVHWNPIVLLKSQLCDMNTWIHCLGWSCHIRTLQLKEVLMKKPWVQTECCRIKVAIKVYRLVSSYLAIW